MSDTVNALVPVLATGGTTFIAAAVGVTIFKWYESWHQAELACRALSGLTSNFARHCIYNMIRITQLYAQDTYDTPNDTLLEKQKFVLAVLSEGTKERMQLIGTELIFCIEHLFLRIRNFNIEIEFVRRNKVLNEDLKKALDYLFFRNVQLAEISYIIAGKFDELIRDSKKTPYFLRFLYIWRNRGTLFNKGEFSKFSTKSIHSLSRWPPPDSVAQMLKVYLEHEGFEAEQYEQLIKAYDRIGREYNNEQREWFGMKWTVKMVYENSGP